MSQYRQYLQQLSTHSPTTAFLCKTFLGLKLLDEFYLGLHLGKDALTCTIINDHYNPVYRKVIDFNKDLAPEYTKNYVSNPAATWVASLDKLFTEIAESLEFDLGRVSAIGGSTEEGLAIWKEGAEVMLRNLDPSLSLPQQLEDLILPLCNDSPSPSSKLHIATPGDKSEDNTESIVDQLLKVTDDTIKQSERISLSGTLLASVLIGKYAETDISDVSLAGLWNTQEQALDKRLINNSNNMKEKLGEFQSSLESVGLVNTYCAKRWRMSTKCVVLPFMNGKSVDLINMNLINGDCLFKMDKRDVLFWYTPLTTTQQRYANVRIDPRHPFLGLSHTSLLTGTSIRSRIFGEDWIKFGDSLRNLDPGCYSKEPKVPKVTRFSFLLQKQQQDPDIVLDSVHDSDTSILCRYEDGQKVNAFHPRHKEMPDAAKSDWETSHMSTDQLIQYKIAQYDARSLIDTMLLSIRFQLEIVRQGRTDVIKRILVTGQDPMFRSGSLLQLISNALCLPVYTLRKTIETGTSNADTRCIVTALLSRFHLIRTDAVKELELPGPIEASLTDDLKQSPTWVEAMQKERTIREEKAITTFSKMITKDAIIHHDHLLVAEPQSLEVHKYNELYREFCQYRKAMFKVD